MKVFQFFVRSTRSGQVGVPMFGSPIMSVIYDPFCNGTSFYDVCCSLLKERTAMKRHIFGTITVFLTV